MTTATKPAAWAREVAQKVWGEEDFSDHPPMHHRYCAIDELAEIIERESPVGKMASVLKDLLGAYRMAYAGPESNKARRQAGAEAERVLREIGEL